MDKRILNIAALIALAIVLIIGGWWVFDKVSTPDQIINAEDTLKLRRVQQARDTSRANIRDFLKNSILTDLTENQQYRSLVELPIQINLNNIGNSEPFKSESILAE